MVVSGRMCFPFIPSIPVSPSFSAPLALFLPIPLSLSLPLSHSLSPPSWLLSFLCFDKPKSDSFENGQFKGKNPKH